VILCGVIEMRDDAVEHRIVSVFEGAPEKHAGALSAEIAIPAKKFSGVKEPYSAISITPRLLVAKHSASADVGELVGARVGASEGDALGAFVGLAVDGAAVGAMDGVAVGAMLGATLGAWVGAEVGAEVARHRPVIAS